MDTKKSKVKPRVWTFTDGIEIEAKTYAEALKKYNAKKEDKKEKK